MSDSYDKILDDTVDTEPEWRWDMGQRLRFKASGREAVFITDAKGTRITWLHGAGGPLLTPQALEGLTARHRLGPYGKGWTSLWGGVR